MSRRLLVIDDSTTIQRVVKLACTDWSVSVAGSYLEAIGESIKQLPDVVIADAALPGIKGVEDYRHLRERLSGIPFVILEGSYQPVDKEAFQKAGFQIFLKKPFEPENLLRTLSQAVGEVPIEPVPEKIDEIAEFRSFQNKNLETSPSLGGDDGFSLDLALDEFLPEAIKTQSSPEPTPEFSRDEASITNTDLRSFQSKEDSSIVFRPPPPPPIDLSSVESDLVEQVDEFKMLDPVALDQNAHDLSFQAEKTQGSQMSERQLLEQAVEFDRQVREEMLSMAKQLVIDYCRENFNQLARETIQEEIRKLTASQAKKRRV